jgi:hypothetical protein
MSPELVDLVCDDVRHFVAVLRDRGKAVLQPINIAG